MTQHISYICYMALLVLSATVVSGLANCPPGCQCDDYTLVVQCGQGQLDVLPIALNPSIQRLIIRSNKIKTIDSSIQFYAELTFLDLSSNHLMTIPPRTFSYQKKLQEVHLNNNKIGQISNKTLMGLSSLTVLNLRGNLISELHQGTFSPVVKLEELNLGENRISFIDPRAFESLTQLRILYMDDNALTSVPDPLIFQTIPNLAELFLGMNTLQSLSSAAFQDIKGLTRLDLRGADLRNITHDAFKGLEALRVMDLSDNRLQRIPTLSLSHLVRLEELSLGQNDFEIIAEGAFVGLKQLKSLSITGSLRLKRIMTGAFATNANLEYLNLSSNKMLIELQEGAFGGLPHLQHIILKANALTTLAEGLFPWRDLITLDISENPIACDCRVMWLRNLLIAKNATSSSAVVADVVCEYPERLLGESLKNLNPTLMGCSYADPQKQALIGALLVGSAATITALALIIYRCRRKIREYLKGGIWGNSALGRKEREYQKTFCDEDFMTRHQHHPCSLGIHSTFPNAYTAHHSNAHHYGMCPIPINDLNVDTQKNFQQLHVPTGTMLSAKKSGYKCSGASEDNASFIMHIKPESGADAGQKLNHYTKPQLLNSNNDACYSYADVPVVQHAHANAKACGSAMLASNIFNEQWQQQEQAEHQRNQLCLTQDHFSKHLQFNSPQDYQNDTNSDIVDPSYIYSNTHYSMPLEQPGQLKTFTPPPLPPALPLRNLLHNTTGRRSMGSGSKQKASNTSHPHATMRNSH